MELLLCPPCDNVETEPSTTSQTLVCTRRPIAELKGNALLWDCVDKPGDTTNAKACIFCGHKFAGGPARIDNHLEDSGTHIKNCIPDLIWKTRHKEVVAELKLRKQIVQQGIDDKASREAARQKSVSSPTIMNTLNMRPKNEEVTEAWAKVLVAKGLAIDLVDDLHFRASITITARAGTQYVDDFELTNSL